MKVRPTAQIPILFYNSTVVYETIVLMIDFNVQVKLVQTWAEGIFLPFNTEVISSSFGYENVIIKSKFWMLPPGIEPVDLTLVRRKQLWWATRTTIDIMKQIIKPSHELIF